MLRIGILLLVCLLAGSAFAQSEDDQGYLLDPPVFFGDEREIPIPVLGVEIPPARKFWPAFGAALARSEAFWLDGTEVQRDLDFVGLTIRAGTYAGLGAGWSAGVSVPLHYARSWGTVAGADADGTATGIGDVLLYAKKRLWQGSGNHALVAVAGVELPTGRNDVDFADRSPVALGFYRGDPLRMPLDWQPGSGSLDGCVGLAYGRRKGRFSYEAIVTTKLHGKSDEDVRLGRLFVAAVSATCGLTRTTAASLEVVFRAQGDDSYPNAPPPGVDRLPLAGITSHGTGVYVNPSVRLDLFDLFTVGLGARLLVYDSQDGMTPLSGIGVILYPKWSRLAALIRPAPVP